MCPGRFTGCVTLCYSAFHHCSEMREWKGLWLWNFSVQDGMGSSGSSCAGRVQGRAEHHKANRSVPLSLSPLTMSPWFDCGSSTLKVWANHFQDPIFKYCDWVIYIPLTLNFRNPFITWVLVVIPKLTSKPEHTWVTLAGSVCHRGDCMREQEGMGNLCLVLLIFL